MIGRDWSWPAISLRIIFPTVSSLIGSWSKEAYLPLVSSKEEEWKISFKFDNLEGNTTMLPSWF